MGHATDDPKAFVIRYLDEIFSKGNREALGDFVAGDTFEAHVTELLDRWRAAFPDLHIEVEGVLVDGDRVVTEETMSGTHTGVYESPRLGPIGPTGRSFSWSRIAIRDLADGRFVDGYWRGEELELLEQLGVRVEVERAG